MLAAMATGMCVCAAAVQSTSIFVDTKRRGTHMLGHSTRYATWWVNMRHRDRISHDDVIKWKHFPRYWPFVRGIHRSPVKSPHKDEWRGALTFSLICAWINDWINNREAGDLRHHRVHYDVTVMDIASRAKDRRDMVGSSEALTSTLMRTLGLGHERVITSYTYINPGHIKG